MKIEEDMGCNVLDKKSMFFVVISVKLFKFRRQISVERNKINLRNEEHNWFFKMKFCDFCFYFLCFTWKAEMFWFNLP